MSLKVMLLKRYNFIMQQPESHRHRWALGLAISLSMLIFVSFAFYKGFISVNVGTFASKKPSSNVANVISAKSAPSPIQNSKETLKSAFGEVKKQFQSFKDSMSSVLVPFITGIEVYERK